ncbi:DUF3053 family protein [Sphingomonas sp. ASY06-1R]|uniref:DUF3053 family protein n=1 Tax=Sphingomonas sp. ASY06-1R TaxID=3445771 RepID=UPI003FA2AA07
MRQIKSAWAAAALLALSSCGSGDAVERKRFVDFLQTRIIDKPGIHVPQLTADERAAFGDYANQYAIITDFHNTLNEAIVPKMKAAAEAGQIRSLQDVVDHREELQTARAGMRALSGALGADLARADAAHGKLSQPAELKAVYDKAYDRVVTSPAAALKNIAPVADKVLGQALDLGNYIEAHRSEVQVSGSMIRTSNPAVQDAINSRLQALQGSQQAAQAAQQEMQSVAFGRAS